ncbi:unnamed protein product [Linum trigynum]|uniref:Uncharacterized protein n=1 Tax=Linum trigynum TaxID=586398 RepID=A0AAV2FWI4_9ROSI
MEIERKGSWASGDGSEAGREAVAWALAWPTAAYNESSLLAEAGQRGPLVARRRDLGGYYESSLLALPLPRDAGHAIPMGQQMDVSTSNLHSAMCLVRRRFRPACLLSSGGSRGACLEEALHHTSLLVPSTRYYERC